MNLVSARFLSRKCHSYILSYLLRLTGCELLSNRHAIAEKWRLLSTKLVLGRESFMDWSPGKAEYIKVNDFITDATLYEFTIIYYPAQIQIKVRLHIVSAFYCIGRL